MQQSKPVVGTAVNGLRQAHELWDGDPGYYANLPEYDRSFFDDVETKLK